MQSNEWKIPLNVAIGIHVMVVLVALYLPGLFKAKPKFADITTVSLISIAEPAVAPPMVKAQAPAPPDTKAQETPPEIAPVPPKIKKAVPIAEAPAKPEPVPAPVPPKAISLKPLQQKKIVEVKEQPVPLKKTEPDLKKVQKLAEAIREEAIQAERAKLAQEELEQERQVLAKSMKNRTSPVTESSSGQPTTGQQTSSQTSSGSNSTLLESQYHAAIANRLHQFWMLPENLQKDPNMTAAVVITIKTDGEIANMFFESKSGDRVFDQFVSKTIELANPLPPIPPALKKQRYEIGLYFKPGSIQ